VVLFPMIDSSLKTNYAEEAYNPLGLVPRAIQMIKAKYPDLFVITDVALDPYSDQVFDSLVCLCSHSLTQGHDGVVKDGCIVNDVSIVQLQKQALMHARAGADMVAPSGAPPLHFLSPHHNGRYDGWKGWGDPRCPRPTWLHSSLHSLIHRKVCFIFLWSISRCSRLPSWIRRQENLSTGPRKWSRSSYRSRSR
jgi:hypothetical protein